MKPLLIHGAFSLLLISVLLLLLGNAMHPLLFTLQEEGGETRFHTNILAEQSLIINSSTDMLSIMQDVLDYSGPIALNIRMKDLEAASRDLDEYARKYKNLDKLVVNLEMTESEIQDFTNNTKLQDDLYRELMNSSYALDELKRLEFRYRDRNDAAGMTTVAYQGQALKRKIQSIRTKYQSTSQNLVNQSEQYHLDTTKIRQSQQEIDRFVNEIITREPETQKNTGRPVQQKLTLIISPEFGTYRDKITYSGFLSGSRVQNETVNITLDNTLYITAVTDDIGLFRKSVDIERVSAGEHLVSAQWYALTSEELGLTVFAVNSTISLDLKARSNLPEVYATGTLMTNRTVRNAPVDLVVDNQTVNKTKTNAKGEYAENLSLVKGTHIVYAYFSDRSYPINDSKSQVYEVVSSGTSITSIRLLGGSADSADPEDGGLLIILLVLVGTSLFGVLVYKTRIHRSGRFFFSKIQGDNQPGSRSDALTSIQRSGFLENENGNDPKSLNGTIVSQYQSVLRSHGLSEAARYVYLGFLHAVSHDLPLSISLTLTPRELIQRIQIISYTRYLSGFVPCYEKIRYGGSSNKDDQQTFEALVHQTDAVIKGEDHED